MKNKPGYKSSSPYILGSSLEPKHTSREQGICVRGRDDGGPNDETKLLGQVERGIICSSLFQPLQLLLLLLLLLQLLLLLILALVPDCGFFLAAASSSLRQGLRVAITVSPFSFLMRPKAASEFKTVCE